MSITISHNTSLHATRLIRANGIDVRTLDHSTIAHPTTWVGKRWTIREFNHDSWKWQRPRKDQPLHVIVSTKEARIRMSNARCHVCSSELPSNAILWLDSNARMCGPEYTFVQMAETLSLPDLVLLGTELCGYFTRNANDPENGPIIDHIRPATTVSELRRFTSSISFAPGLAAAKKAIDYICEGAASLPEAILATIYSLPLEELGYGMGPLTLNRRVDIDDNIDGRHSRYPDITFPFASMGINYEGEGHLDLNGVADATRRVILAKDEEVEAAKKNLSRKLAEVRAKAVDDIRRDRQLAAKGAIVFRATKEDLYEPRGLDELTRQLLSCAREVYGIDTSSYEKALEDSELCRERAELLASMLPTGHPRSDWWSDPSTIGIH